MVKAVVYSEKSTAFNQRSTVKEKLPVLVLVSAAILQEKQYHVTSLLLLRVGVAANATSLLKHEATEEHCVAVFTL